MDESTQVRDLNKTIETLNNSHTEYQNYIQTNKNNLATAITNAGIVTRGDDTFDTMITNISNISNISRTKISLGISYLRTGGNDNVTKFELDISAYKKLTFSVYTTHSFNNVSDNHAWLLLDGKVYKNFSNTTVTDEIIDISNYNTLTFSVCYNGG